MQKYQLKNNIKVAVFRLKDQKSGDSKKFFKGLHYHYEITDPGSLEFELKVNNSEYKITLYSYIVRIGDNILVYSPKEFEKYFELIEEKEKEEEKESYWCDYHRDYHQMAPPRMKKTGIPNLYYCPLCHRTRYFEEERDV
jgi:hypothetical protein